MNSEALRSESDEPHPASADRSAPPKAFASSDSKWELIQLFVRVTQVLGIPRSVGEIFGFIFTSPSPVAFDEIVEALGVSSGSASRMRELDWAVVLPATYLLHRFTLIVAPCKSPPSPCRCGRRGTVRKEPYPRVRPITLRGAHCDSGRFRRWTFSAGQLMSQDAGKYLSMWPMTLSTSVHRPSNGRRRVM